MQINASMLHELRMVILHGTKLLRRSKGSRTGSSTLLCVSCLKQRNFTSTPAVTITRGNAVCFAHLS